MRQLEENEVARQFLEGLDYPVSKHELVTEAREARLIDTVARALERLPDRRYESARAVAEELNRSRD